AGETINLAPTTAGTDHDVIDFTSLTQSVPGKAATIQNFDPSKDFLDLSEIQGITTIQGLISGTTVNADSIAWKVVNGKTIVYANTTSSAQTIGSTSMEIDLTGAPTITAANFLNQSSNPIGTLEGSEPPVLTVGKTSVTVSSGHPISLPISLNYDL